MNGEDCTESLARQLFLVFLSSTNEAELYRAPEKTTGLRQVILEIQFLMCAI
jgi:hypothetical protein